VETKGPDNHNGKDEADAEATILRFPRDWFGPTEELVPFGPRADGVAVAEDDEQSVALGEGLPPSSASAFWSEDSARIHDAVEGPAVESAVFAQAPVADGPGWPRFSLGRVLLVACCGVIGLGLVGRLMFHGDPQRALPPSLPRAAIHVRVWTAVSHPPVVRRAVSARKPSRAPEPKPAASQGAQANSSGSTGSTGSVPVQAASAPSSGTSATQSDSGRGGSGGGAGGGGAGGGGASAASAGGSSQQAFGANGALGPGSSPNS
jgi:hypothetical protein